MRAGEPARAPRYCRALWRKRRPRGRAAVGEPDRRRAAPGPTRGRRRRLWARRTRRRPCARPRHRRPPHPRNTPSDLVAALDVAGDAVAFGAEATDGDDGAAVRGAVGAVVPGGVGLAAGGARELRFLRLAALVAHAALLRGARVLAVVLEVLDVVVRARRLGRARARPRRRGRGGARARDVLQRHGHDVAEELEQLGAVRLLAARARVVARGRDDAAEHAHGEEQVEVGPRRTIVAEVVAPVEARAPAPVAAPRRGQAAGHGGPDDLAERLVRDVDAAGHALSAVRKRISRLSA